MIVRQIRSLLFEMTCWDNFMHCCCGCTYMVFMLTISCCGIRRVNYGGRKVKRKRKIIRSKRKLIERIMSLTRTLATERKILVVGEANSGKSSFIRSLQSIFLGTLEGDHLETDGSTEACLSHEGRKLPLVICEYTPKQENADDTTGLLGMEVFAADVVIFVVDKCSVSNDTMDELCNRYNSFSNFLRYNGVPFNVVLTKMTL